MAGASLSVPASNSPSRRFGIEGFRLGHLLGVELRADWSVLIIFLLVLVNLGAGVFPLWHPDWPGWLAWSTALGAALLFFVSLLAHELSHALVARRHGIAVPRITLFIFGGLAHMESDPPSPRAELQVAAVGPIVSLVIGAAALLGAAALVGRDGLNGLTGAEGDMVAATMQGFGPLATLLLWLGPINVLLGLFNVVPGFPLDGGRVLRATLWLTTGDLLAATRWAVRGGRLVAWALMAIGAMSLFAGAIGQGLWLLLIGWFLNNAARLSLEQVVMQQTLEQVPVRRVMRTLLDRVPSSLSVAAFVREHFMTSDQTAFPVEAGGTLVGLVSIDDIRTVPEEAWMSTPVERIMTPLDRLVTLVTDTPASKALEALSGGEVEQIPVMDGPHLLGLVRRRDLLRFVRLRGGIGPDLLGTRDDQSRSP